MKISSLVFLLLFFLCLSVVYNLAPIPGVLSKFYTPTEPDITLILAGDVMLGRTVMTTSLAKSDPSYPFLKVKDFLQTADIVFLNLENPFVTSCPRKYDGMVFCADPVLADGLSDAGIDIVNLANNHTRNYGQKGLDETVSVLSNHGIFSTGLGDLVTKKVGETTFGFLGFDFLSHKPSTQDYDLIKSSKAKVDILVVSVHWGVEYTSAPSAAQKQWANQIMASGADIIMGHHPHWVQDIEYVDGKPVYYSLGNFVFDQMWSEKTRQGLVIKLTFRDKKLIKEEKFPTYMNSWAQPELSSTR
jgi:poly-gamma-glutamate capsule biosynthesis protein CapA/YwtB (metallophosphatase superfamily)